MDLPSLPCPLCRGGPGLSALLPCVFGTQFSCASVKRTVWLWLLRKVQSTSTAIRQQLALLLKLQLVLLSLYLLQVALLLRNLPHPRR